MNKGPVLSHTGLVDPLCQHSLAGSALPCDQYGGWIIFYFCYYFFNLLDCPVCCRQDLVCRLLRFFFQFSFVFQQFPDLFQYRIKITGLFNKIICPVFHGLYCTGNIRLIAHYDQIHFRAKFSEIMDLVHLTGLL